MLISLSPQHIGAEIVRRMSPDHMTLENMYASVKIVRVSKHTIYIERSSMTLRFQNRTIIETKLII